MVSCPKCSTPAPEGSRFCPSCATQLPESTVSPTQTSVPGDPTSASSQATPASLPSLEQSRFLPGAMVAGRYRIVGLIGRGGMGEVYRADDLKLGQPVALKFLPPAFEQDPGRLARLLTEVKLARQVSHPNVCRVYDVGDVDPSTGSGQARHFLSMEYVDGEDLASLLVRIGRLPGDRAAQMARQLCAGLAAAHEQGILHRDLKPANVLIDGRGRAKITDFGVAGMAETIQGAEVRAGTPEYMAPEQMAGTEVSVRSDIYSLGLVLYELFTGKQAFSAGSIAELARLQQETTPTNPSTLVDGFDPVVERVIQHCLERDPANRPPTALAVAAALPGGDPLAAALAAGETPSPELVAAAGDRVDVKPWLAWTCLAVVLIGLPLLVFFSSKVMLFAQVPLELPPEVLEARAQEIVAELGFEEPPAGTAQGFLHNTRYLGWMGDEVAAADWPDALAGPPSSLYYWYRQSPQPLTTVNQLRARVGWTDPPSTRPGMISVGLDTEGRLVRFLRVPTDEDAARADVAAPDWSALFAFAELDPDRFEPVEPKLAPPAYADQRAAWEGSFASRPELILRVEAAALGGRPVYFRTSGPWTESASTLQGTQRVLAFVASLVFAGLALAAALLARSNIRQGRGDRKGAKRFALFMLGVVLLIWIFSVNNVPGFQLINRFTIQIGTALVVAGIAWVTYLAIEPFVRRRWPDTLVSWARLLDGKWRDPLVGRDLVLGAALAVALVGLDQLTALAPSWIGQPVAYERPVLDELLGGRLVVASLLQCVTGIVVIMLALLSMVVFRVLLRKTWAAFLVTLLLIILFTAPTAVSTGQILLTSVFWFALLVVLMRFGLLAATAAMVLHMPLGHGTITANLGAWYGGYTIAAVLFLLLAAVYGFYTSFGGHSILGDHAFND